jgi:hypothetical protein
VVRPTSTSVVGSVGGGLAVHFKAGFSGTDRRFTWRLVCDPDAYDALVEAAGVPREPGGHFPAYRAARPPGEHGDRQGRGETANPPSD